MSLANETLVRSEGNLPESIGDEKIKPHLTAAAIELKRLLSSAEYAKIEALKDSVVDEEKEKFEACQKAEANLAMSYAVTVLNIETQGTGIVREKGWDQSRSSMLSQNETKTLAAYFRDLAMKLIDPYIPKPVDEETAEPATDRIITGSIMLGAI